MKVREIQMCIEETTKSEPRTLKGRVSEVRRNTDDRQTGRMLRVRRLIYVSIVDNRGGSVEYALIVTGSVCYVHEWI